MRGTIGDHSETEGIILTHENHDQSLDAIEDRPSIDGGGGGSIQVGGIIGSSTFMSYPVVSGRDIEIQRLSQSRNSSVLGIAALTILFGGIAMAVATILLHSSQDPYWAIVILVTSATLSGALYVGGTYLLTKFKERDRKDRKSAGSDTLTQEDGTLATAAVAAAESNRKSLATYQELTRRQATSSYRIAQVAIFVGFLLLTAGAVLALTSDNVTAQVIVGSLAALGSAISGYIAATSMKMHQRAQAQMNFYYAQPLVQSYILEAERLCKDLSEDGRRDKSLEKIIDRTLEGASVAGFLIARGAEDTANAARSQATAAASLTPISSTS